MRQARALFLAALVMAGCLLAGGALLLIGPWSPERSNGDPTPVAVFPTPGDPVAAPQTQITLRGITIGQLGSIIVTGSESGVHTGQLLGDSDGDGGSFLPSTPFTPGEQVTVQTTLDVVGGTNGAFEFTVATPALLPAAKPPIPAKRVKGDVYHFASEPALRPAALKVTKLPSHTQPGDLFVAPQNGPLQYGPMILGPYGGLIWFDPLPSGQSATDFRLQTYRGQDVLTWWQGDVSTAGTGAGVDEIYNSSYQPVATVKAGNGLSADLHEFQITPQGTALITAFYPVYWDATSVKGSNRAIVLDSVVQEIDIPTGLVLAQWDSLAHVPLTDSEVPYPTVGGHPYDYFHVNSVQLNSDGSFTLSARNTWTVYDVDPNTGSIVWRLNGKQSSFKMAPGASFAFQHDARQLGNGEITLFDDGGGPPNVHSQSRGLTLRLDTQRRTATVVRQSEHRPSLLAQYEGSSQLLPNRDDLVGWGQQPFVTEFNSHGEAVFDARFVDANSSYRAYRFAWQGTPQTKPATAERSHGGVGTVYASWNGATAVTRWRVLAGANRATIKAVASARKAAFETAIKIPHGERYYAVQALNSTGRVLGTSETKATVGN